MTEEDVAPLDIAAYRRSPVHTPLLERAARVPASPAISYQGRQITYGGVAQQALKVAGALIDAGITRGDIVAVDIPRSPMLVTVWLGILAAGGAYLSLDPEWPRQRKTQILAASRAFALCSADWAPRETLVPIIHPATASERDIPPLSSLPAVTGADACCVYYTSGSSGSPKGVVSPHSGTVRMALSAQQLGMGSDTVTLQSSALPWDLPSIELWGALLHGGRCVLNHDRLLTPAGLQRFVSEGVNTIWLSTSLLNAFVDEALYAFSGLRVLWTGGERMSVDHVRRLASAHPGLAIFNCYGPVEASIFSTVHRVAPSDLAPGASDMPIGLPTFDTECYVLDGADSKAAEIAAMDEVGEIGICGSGLGLRYIGDAQGSFQEINIVNIGPRRVYMTGDRGLVSSDGMLHFCGREDRQVKLRGLRIEPQEVEAVMMTHPAVRQATVHLFASAVGHELGAWLTTTSDATASPTVLRAWLAERLPAYLVPTTYMILARLPLGASGKVERDALPAPSAEHRASSEASLARTSSAMPGRHAEAISAVISELLSIDRVDLDDDIFQLGGDSLTVTRLAARLYNMLELDVLATDIFCNPTPRRLSILLDGPNTPAVRSRLAPLVLADRHRFPLSAGQLRFWLAEEIHPHSQANVISRQFRVEGDLDCGALVEAFAGEISRHEVLRTTYAESGCDPAQVVRDQDDYEVPFRFVDVHSDVQEGPGAVEALVDEELAKGFSLASELPLRLLLVRCGEREWRLVFTVHHIAFDGWSETVFFQGFTRSYDRLMNGYGPEEGIATPYRDYVGWESAWLASSVRAQRERYWRKALESVADVRWPPSKAPATTHTAIERQFTVARGVLAETRQTLKALSCPLSVGIGFAFHSAIAALALSDNVAVGTLIEGRQERRFDSTIGFFARTVAVYPGASSDPSPRGLVHFRSVVADALSHSDLPFDAVVAAVAPARSRSNPIFQALYTVQHEPVSTFSLGDCRANALPISLAADPFDIVLELFERDDGFVCVVTAHPSLFSQELLTVFEAAFTSSFRGLASAGS